MNMNTVNARIFIRLAREFTTKTRSHKEPTNFSSLCLRTFDAIFFDAANSVKRAASEAES